MDNNNVKITINKEDRYVYYLAKHVIEKYNGRKIVTWIRSNRFERVLKAYFNLTVSFNVSLRREICDGKKTRHLDDISPAECYLVVLDRDCDEDTKKLLYAKGFKIDEDCLFFRHTPIILENYKCTNEGYKDIYGNCIECHSGAVIKRSVFRLGGNSITIGNNVNGISNLSFDLTTNTDIQIQEGCVINASTRIESLGSNGCATVRIGERCRFTDALLRLYVSPYETAIICNSYCSFETHFEAH
ncbi:MAG: hypothetical protein LUC91_02085, partial [Prevotella sp.]|nr:hypothetical protein [Prevotella sp.]